MPSTTMSLYVRHFYWHFKIDTRLNMIKCYGFHMTYNNTTIDQCTNILQPVSVRTWLYSVFSVI